MGKRLRNVSLFTILKRNGFSIDITRIFYCAIVTQHYEGNSKCRDFGQNTLVALVQLMLAPAAAVAEQSFLVNVQPLIAN